MEDTDTTTTTTTITNSNSNNKFTVKTNLSWLGFEGMTSCEQA
jgi:hypothetical protein